MKPAVFAYHRPTSVAETIECLGRYEGDARVLAGGQSLVPMLNMRLWQPSALVDINEVDELDDIRVEGGDTILGALVRYSTVQRSSLVAGRLPLLPWAVAYIGDRQVRNRGTVGGALAHGDPTGEMPLACLVLDAEASVCGPNGVRRIPSAELYEGSYASTLAPDELLCEIRFPPHPTHFALTEVCRKHNDFAVISVAAAGNRAPDGQWHDLRIGVGGAADGPVLVPTQQLAGTRLRATELDPFVEAALAVLDPPTDARASGDYRRHLVAVYLRRVLAELRDADSAMAQHSPAKEVSR